MKLISMMEFVDLQEETSTLDMDQGDWYNQELNKLTRIRSYSRFLKRKLTLGMFVPINKNGNVLNEPINYSAFEIGMSGKDFNFNFIDCQEYKEALVKVLFLGFEINKEFESLLWHKSGYGLSINDLHLCTIETYSGNGYFFELTESASKQIGL